MTRSARQLTTILGLCLIAGVAFGMELHRHIMVAVWPLITGFIETYITF